MAVTPLGDIRLYQHITFALPPRNQEGPSYFCSAAAPTSSCGCCIAFLLTISLPLQLESAQSPQLYLHRSNYNEDEIDQPILLLSSFRRLDDEFFRGCCGKQDQSPSRALQCLLLRKVRTVLRPLLQPLVEGTGRRRSPGFKGTGRRSPGCHRRSRAVQCLLLRKVRSVLRSLLQPLLEGRAGRRSPGFEEGTGGRSPGCH